MDNNDYEGVSPRDTRKAGTTSSNGFKEPRISNEDSPLLGNGSEQLDDDGDGDDAPAALEWDGAADFLNVPWWNKPSVSRGHGQAHVQILIPVDILAAAHLLPLRSCLRWHHCPKTQPYPLTRMPGVSF
jgi:hypothetical protein